MNWLRHHIPTRENIHRYRLLRPFAPHLSQPALTKSLHELEDILQLRLFDRLPRGMHPTDSGAVFVRSAKARRASRRS